MWPRAPKRTSAVYVKYCRLGLLPEPLVPPEDEPEPVPVPEVVPAPATALPVELPVEPLPPATELSPPLVVLVCAGSLSAEKGFFSLKTLRCELSTELASSATVGSLLAFDAWLAPVGAGGADVGCSSSAGTASVAAKSATATGQRRLARRSCQRSRKKVVMAWWRLRSGART